MAAFTPIQHQRMPLAIAAIGLLLVSIAWMFHRIASAFVIASDGLQWTIFSRFFGVAVGRRAKLVDLPWNKIASVTLNEATTPVGVRITPRDPYQFTQIRIRAGRRFIRFKLDEHGGWLLRGSGSTARPFVEACDKALANAQ